MQLQRGTVFVKESLNGCSLLSTSSSSVRPIGTCSIGTSLIIVVHALLDTTRCDAESGDDDGDVLLTCHMQWDHWDNEDWTLVPENLKLKFYIKQP